MSNAVVPSQTWFRRVISLIGIAAIGWDTFARFSRGSIPLWVLVCVLVAEVAWIGFAAIPPRYTRVGTVLLGLMIVGGGIVSTSTDAVGVVPVLVALLWLGRDQNRPFWLSLVFGFVGMIIVLIGDLILPIASLGLLSIEAGLVVAFFGGFSRRQFLVAEARSRELVGEQARADVLDARQQLAHDIHDVLAHSLGGLVIQLDAVDALLEAGDTKGAAARVRDSRALAAEGLSEARRAVAALGEPPASSRLTGDEFVASLRDLLAVHRSLGGSVEVVETGTRHELGGPLAGALRRALQEGLTNARKHAPGEPVTARLSWQSGAVQLSLSNPLPTGGAGVAAKEMGGGHGLVGMRERFAALPGGSATAGAESGLAESGSFVVRVAGETA
jgi:signal transduction histidine kinase